MASIVANRTRSRKFVIPANAETIGLREVLGGGDPLNFEGGLDEYTARIQAWILAMSDAEPSSEWSQIRRGDAIQLEWKPNHNEGLFFWNGSRVIGSDYDLDEYGEVSHEFAFPEFDIHYFADVINHNTYVHIDKAFRKQIRANAARDIVAHFGHCAVVHSWFVFCGRKIWILCLGGEDVEALFENLDFISFDVHDFESVAAIPPEIKKDVLFVRC